MKISEVAVGQLLVGKSGARYRVLRVAMAYAVLEPVDYPTDTRASGGCQAIVADALSLADMQPAPDQEV